MIRAILFDLDGTLLDTAPDLAAALNRVRAAHHLPALAYSVIRPLASHGSFALTRLGFALDDAHPDFEPRRRQLLDEYHAHIADETRPFAGLTEILTALAARGLRWGIVTNKPGWLTTPLLAAVSLGATPGCVVSGDTLTARKPDPAPLRYAAAQLGCAPRECVYIGDAARDVEAGQRAGMATVIARYGYLGADDVPEDWGADVCVATPAALAAWLAALPVPRAR